MKNNENAKLSFIASILSIVCFIPVAVGLVWGIIKKNIESIITTSIVAGLLLVILIIIFIRAFTKKHKSRFYRWLKYISSHKEDVILEIRDTNYEFKNRESIFHWKLFTARAHKTSLHTFTDRYVYSGQATCNLKTPKAGQSILETHKQLGWDFYTIEFDPVPQGDTVDLEMRMDEIIDKEHRSLPYLATGIYEPTKRLKMTVKFWDGFIPTNPRIKIYRNYTDTTPFSNEPLVFSSETKTLNYELDYPVLNYKYAITWNF